MISNLSPRESRRLTSSSKVESEECVNKDIKSLKFLKKKTNRNKTKVDLPHNERCDICLELEKYSQQNLVKCKVCESKCHLSCYNLENPKDNINFSNVEEENLKCSRCQHSSKMNADYRNFHCGICDEHKGILNNYLNKGEFYHTRCLRFISEIFKDDQKKGRIKDSIRKWRLRMTCKICKSKASKGMVLKCANTKCKSYYHIPCAIARGLIPPIDFLHDFYKIEATQGRIEVIPFYCPSHGRDLAVAYELYTSQMDQVLLKEKSREKSNSVKEFITNEQTREDADMHELPELLYDISVSNCISNLVHPEFNFEFERNKDVPPREMNTCKVLNDILPKPNYDNDDIFDLSSQKFYNEFTIGARPPLVDIECRSNLSHIARQFYEYFTKDMENLKRTGNSNITISQIKELKLFFMEILKNYKELDSDLKKFYDDIERNGHMK